MWGLGPKFSFNGVLLGAGAHRLSSLCCDECLGHLHMILIVNGFLRCQKFFFFFITSSRMQRAPPGFNRNRTEISEARLAPAARETPPDVFEPWLF